jgi:hypothetical protein
MYINNRVRLVEYLISFLDTASKGWPTCTHHTFDFRLPDEDPGVNGNRRFCLKTYTCKCDDWTFPLARIKFVHDCEWTLVFKKRSTLAIAGYAS